MTQAPIDTERLAKLDTIEIHNSSHPSFAKGHCAMEVVAWLAREPHTDHPQCARPVIGAFMRKWNDSFRDDTEARTRHLRSLLPLLVGSKSSRAVEKKRAYLAVDWSIRTRTPTFLRLVNNEELNALALQLEQLAPIAPIERAEQARDARKIVQAASTKASACRSAAAAAAAYAAAYAAYAYADAYADADADADAYADAYAAAAAAAAAYAAAAAAAAYAAAYDPDMKRIVEAAKTGGYSAARKVADETIGKRLRERNASLIEQGRVSAADLVRRMCAVTEAS